MNPMCQGEWVKKKPVIHGISPQKNWIFHVGDMNYKLVIWINTYIYMYIIYGYMDYKLWVIWIINHGSVGPILSVMYCESYSFERQEHTLSFLEFGRLGSDLLQAPPMVLGTIHL